MQLRADISWHLFASGTLTPNRQLLFNKSVPFRPRTSRNVLRGLQKRTFVENTSRISNKLREMESGFKELLPPKLKGFIIKRQAKLTHDQAKHLHFYIPTRGLEADKMVDTLNRLDQTDALVEQILGDRAKLEHHDNRGHAHPNSHAQEYPMEAETTTSSESNHYHNHKTSSDTESDQLDWDPERIYDDGYPLVDENGSTLVPVPRHKESGKFGRICVSRSRDVATINPTQTVTRKLCAKLCSKRNHREETETSALHSETKREITAQNVSLEPS